MNLFLRKFNFRTLAVFVSTVAIITLSHSISLAGEDIPDSIRDNANNFTVLIKKSSSLDSSKIVPKGSGVLVAQEGTNYYVLTVKHNVELIQDQYEVVTPDGIKYPISSNQIWRSPGDLDLALLSFSSAQSYSIASIGYSDPDSLFNNATVYLSGWHLPEQEPEYKIVSGQTLEINERRDSGTVIKGYALSYDLDAKFGMSGGPLLNSEGCLVGVHGRTRSFGPGQFLGIPINTNLTFFTYLNTVDRNKVFPTSAIEKCGDSVLDTSSENLLVNVCKSYPYLPNYDGASQWLENQVKRRMLELFTQIWQQRVFRDGDLPLQLNKVCSDYGKPDKDIEEQNRALKFLQRQLSEETIEEFIKKLFTDT